MEFVVDVNLEQVTWEDLIPVISFDDEDSSSSSFEDLQDDAWMDLPSCSHSQDGDLIQQQDLMDALYSEDGYNGFNLNLTLDNNQSDIIADALKAAFCKDNQDVSLSETTPSTPASQVSVSHLSSPSQGRSNTSICSSQDQSSTPTSTCSQDRVTSPSSSVTSGVWSCSDYEALSPRFAASPVLPPSKSYQNPMKYTATMSSTPIDHFLANWLAQQMTPNNTEQRQYNKSSNKPPESYLTLIAKAILSLPSHRVLLSDIYSFCLDNYEYFRTAPKTWKNAVRHNLCVNECFIKNGRAPQGRGFYWSIHPACMQSFLSGDFRRKEARQLAVDMNKSRHTRHQNPSASYYI